MSYKILITGIPGTGKTDIGEKLENDYGFKHINLELEEGVSRRQLFSSPIEFIDILLNEEQNVVVTWGFVPDYLQTSIVISFKEKGFKLLWFDGNREAARIAFNKRGTVSEELLDLQLNRIIEFDVVNKIKPHIFDTFKQNGTFKDKDDIIKEILNIF